MTKRTMIVTGLSIFVVAASIGSYSLFRPQKSAKPRFEKSRVDSGSIVAKVTATGTLSALVTVTVGSQVSGVIQALYADFNTQVKIGQVLARINPALFKTVVEQAQANHLAAKANLIKAQVQAADAERLFNRAKSMLAQNLIAQQDYDTAQVNLDVAKAGIDAARGAVAQTEAALHQAQVNLDYTTIISPINGMVISRNVDVGQTVAASLAAPTLFTIAENLQRMQVDTSVAEADVGKLGAEMTATFAVDAYPGETFTGKIRQIRNAPQILQNVVTYDAVIDVSNDDLKLRPGMTANVTFIYAQKDDVLRIPNSALRFRPPASMRRALNGATGSPPGKRGKKDTGKENGATAERTVWVLGAGGPIQTKILPGISDGSFTEVAGGDLKEGDEVITDTLDEGGPAAGPMGGGGLRRIF